TASGSTSPKTKGAESPHAASQRLLTKPSGSATKPKSSSSPSKPKSSSATKPAPSGSATKPAPSGSATTSAPSGSGAAPSASSTKAPKPHRCSNNPFLAVFKADPSLQKIMPNAESCPSPAISDNKQCKPWTALSSTQQQQVNTALQNYDCPAARS